jgi:hypothetical protein
MYKVVVMIFGAIFFNMSAMHIKTDWQNAQDYVLLLVQDLVQRDDKNSIVIVPFKTNVLQDGTAKREASETMLSDIALNGVRVCLALNIPQAGKSFLVIDNKVNDYEEDPACFQGLLCKKVDEKIVENKVNRTSTESYESSFIVYNMPYYKHDEKILTWPYGHEFGDLLSGTKKPCLVLIDEDIYNKEKDVLCRQFCGKRKILEYNKELQSYTEYKPSVLPGISFSSAIFWGALITVGLYYIMPSGLAKNFNANL